MGFDHFQYGFNDGNIQRSMIDSLTLVFSQAVSSFSSGAITLSGASGITLSVTNPSSDGVTWLITFSGSGLSYGSLPDGDYTLTVTGSDVNYVAGGTMSSNQTFTFHRLLGDFQDTGAITTADWDAFISQFGVWASSTNWYMDFLNTSEINGLEFSTFSSQYDNTESTHDSGPILEGISTTEGVNPGFTLGTGTTYVGGFAPEDLYYSSQDQVIQENEQNPSSGSMQVHAQYVWGMAYVNQLVLRDRDADGSSSTGNLGISGSGLDERLFAEQDANWNVTSLTNTSGTVIERFVYTPYGTVTALNGSGDQTIDTVGQNYLFQGMRLDPTTGLYHADDRDDSPSMQRWMQQDPDGYVNGANLYQFVESNPLGYVDPNGTDAEGSQDETFQPFNSPGGPTTQPILNLPTGPTGHGEPGDGDDPNFGDPEYINWLRKQIQSLPNGKARSKYKRQLEYLQKRPGKKGQHNSDKKNFCTIGELMGTAPIVIGGVIYHIVDGFPVPSIPSLPVIKIQPPPPGVVIPIIGIIGIGIGIVVAL